jgi:hypothetical protein
MFLIKNTFNYFYSLNPSNINTMCPTGFRSYSIFSAIHFHILFLEKAVYSLICSASLRFSDKTYFAENDMKVRIALQIMFECKPVFEVLGFGWFRFYNKHIKYFFSKNTFSFGKNAAIVLLIWNWSQFVMCYRLPFD